MRKERRKGETYLGDGEEQHDGTNGVRNIRVSKAAEERAERSNFVLNFVIITDLSINPKKGGLLLLLLSTTLTQSVRFDLQSAHTKCIAEDIKADAMTVGNYKIINPNEPNHPMPDSHKITVRVTSVKGNNYHYADRVESGQFAFQAREPGDYMACFWAADHKPPITITVDLDWKSGVSAKDWSNAICIAYAKSGNLAGFVLHHSQKKGQCSVNAKAKVMQLELEKLFETVTSIHDEMFYLREREEEMQKLNVATNSRMGFLSFLSLVVCLSVAGLQLWHLKTFFEKKKII
ncbi:hypothetical protein LguiA_000400 [Lonicera macranthoides]